MSKTIAFRGAVNQILNNIAPAVYYGQAADDHPKRYVVYDCEEIDLLDDLYTIELEVNCMDYGTDTVPCETMADNIQSALNKQVVITDEIMFICYSNRRQPVYEEDRKIIRRRLLFNVNFYERGV